MKIAFVMDHVDRRSGTNRVVCELAPRLARRHEVHLIANSVAPDLPSSLRIHRVWVWPRPTFLKIPLFALMSTRAARREPFDFVIAQGANCFSANVVIAHQCIAAVLDAVAASPARRIRERLLRRAARWIHDVQVRYMERIMYRDPTRRHIIAVSEGLRRDLLRYYTGGRGQIAVIQNGVDPQEFTPANRERYRDATRRQLGIGPEEAVLLFVGGDWGRKGVEFAIASLAHLRDLRVRLVVVGNGEVETYNALALADGTADRVVFTGHQADCRPYYAAADLFVLPTCYESFSLLIPEAAASGLPVLVTRVNGAEEFIEHGANGFFIEQDGADIAAKVRQILASGRLVEMSARARATAEQYTWDRQAERLEAYLQGLLDRAL
jgi:glycosyltransferase involved in cell wall biosynthesis